MIGTTVSHYHVLGRLGAGAMGVVYDAEDLRLGRRVALKFLPDSLATDAQSLARFEREARTASALNHPNICTIYDIGERQGSPFIVMERLEGETLRSRMAAGALPPDEFMDKALQIASAMAAAHAQQIVHRDLKPANIFITRNGSVKVVDFGLAKSVHTADFEATTTTSATVVATDEEPELLTLPGTVQGTLPYMAPEQISGWPADPRSDVFALGVIFYEALTARRPFAGAGFDELRQQICRSQPASPASINRAVPPRLAELVLRCLEKNPDDRFPSAVELLMELEAMEQSEARPPRSADRGDSPRAAASRIGALAVLPFASAGGGQDSEWLASGLCEDLIRRLSQLAGLRVKARNVVWRYHGQAPTPQAVGAELDVDAIVTGTLGSRADQLSVSVDLVRCDDGSLVWGERFTRRATDLAAVEDDVLQRVVKQIALRLQDAGVSTLPRQHAPSPDAHHLYLRGRYYWNERTPDALQRAIDCFRQAVEVDPAYALAFSGLADAYTALAFYDTVPASDVMPRARAAAQRAVQIDGQLPEAHASLGLVSAIGDFAWETAGRELRAALDLNPSLAYAHHWYAMQLSTLGHADQAHAEITRALELDPLAPAAQADAFNILIRARRYDDCIHEANRLLKVEPRSVHAWAALARAEQFAGRAARAVDAIEKAIGLDPTSVRLRALLASARAAAGQPETAARIREALNADRASRYVPPFWLCLVELALQRPDSALALLEQSVNERYPQVAYLGVEPAFDSLRGLPAFPVLLERIGLGGPRSDAGP